MNSTFTLGFDEYNYKELHTWFSRCVFYHLLEQVNQCVCFARVSIDCVIMFYCHFYFEISFAVIVLIPCLGAFLQHPSLFLSGTSPTGNTQSSTPNEVAMTPPPPLPLLSLFSPPPLPPPPSVCLTLFCLSSHFTVHSGSVRRTCWSWRDYSGHHIYDHDP